MDNAGQWIWTKQCIPLSIFELRPEGITMCALGVDDNLVVTTPSIMEKEKIWQNNISNIMTLVNEASNKFEFTSLRVSYSLHKFFCWNVIWCLPLWVCEDKTILVNSICWFQYSIAWKLQKCFWAHIFQCHQQILLFYIFGTIGSYDTRVM